MTTAPKAASGRERARVYRGRLRARGLRPIQIWVPDTRSPSFRAEAHRQSLAAAGGGGGDDQSFIDAISGWPDE